MSEVALGKFVRKEWQGSESLTTKQEILGLKSGSRALPAFTGTTVVGRMVLRVWRPFGGATLITYPAPVTRRGELGFGLFGKTWMLALSVSFERTAVLSTR